MNDDLITLLRSIDAQLGPIAAYAQHLLAKETGLKEVRIAAYVRSHNAGGQMLHLYTDHPAVLKRVGRLYEEHFSLMPFDPFIGKVFEGEAAPSRDWAEKNGYLVHVAPFTALYAPTGKTTDNGHPTYRFQRILTLDTPPTPSAAPLSAPPNNPPIPSPAPSAHPSNPPTASAPSPAIHTGDPLACPTCGKDWRHHNSACADHRDPKSPATPSTHPTNPSTPTPRITRTFPLAPKTIRRWIQQSTDDNIARQRRATPAQTGAVHQALTSAIPDEATRRRFQEWLIGYPSMKEWSGAQFLALHAWLKPSAKNGPTDPFVPEEIAQALAFLSDYVPHPLFVTAQDAIDWAVTQGAFPNPGVAGAAYTARWIQWRRPSFEDMLSRWADYIPTLIPS